MYASLSLLRSFWLTPDVHPYGVLPLCEEQKHQLGN